MTTISNAAQGAVAQLLDAHEVAKTLGCSWRHVYRLSDAGRMPAPIKLGRLTKWRRADLESWLAGGCKPVRQTAGGAR